ncbi:hypothetical protein [Helcococcus massiliensis]|uniref:hypothetical protein n=1 Tax=Helcococcus massiliensis TaxID=2040290 RepID=UPI0013564FF3|nr:hypothetical protein [Helcococcus massiliensis]
MKKRNKRNRKKNRLARFLGLLFIISVLGFLYYFFIYREKNKINKLYQSYYNSTFDQAYNKYSGNLYYKKYNKDEESASYVKLDPNTYTIKNKEKSNFEDYLVNKLMDVLEENQIKQEDFSIVIEDGDETLLAINDKKTLSNYKIDDYIYLLLIDDLIGQGTIKLEDVEEHLDSIYIQNNKDRITSLASYINGMGYNLTSFKSKVLGRSNIESMKVSEVLKFFKMSENKDTVLKKYYLSLLEETSNLFLNPVYTKQASRNISLSNSNVKYDIGYVNSDQDYYYSIYSDKLSDENIHIIADAIDRNIKELKLNKTLID